MKQPNPVNQREFMKSESDFTDKSVRQGSTAPEKGVLRNKGSFAGNLVMFCQKAIVFAALVCFIIIWGGLVIVAQSDTLSDLIKEGFRKGLLLTGNAEGFVRAVMLIVMAVLILLLLGAAFRQFNRVGRRRLYIYSAVMLVVMIGIYVFFLTQLRIVPTNDARTVTDLAYTIAKTGMQSLDTDNVYANYFSKYGNNYPIVLLLAGLFKVMLAVGITDIWLPLYLLNMLALLLGALFTWLTARKVFGLCAAVKVQLLMTLCPVYYLMMFWVYTNTLSVPFVMGMIYLAFCIRDVVMGNVRTAEGNCLETNEGRASSECNAESVGEGRQKVINWCKLALLSALAGLVCSLGFLLRATNAIVVIAAVICMLFYVIKIVGSCKSADGENETGCNQKQEIQDGGICISRNVKASRAEEETREKSQDGDACISRVQKKEGRREIRAWIARCAASCLIAAVIAVGSYSAVNSVCRDFFAAVSDNNYPVTHWLMMGSHGNAMYNSEDSEFTNSFETAEEKKEATWTQTVANYKEAGVAGTLKLFVKKMVINWSDGYFAMDMRLEQTMKYSPVYAYIAGNHNDAFHLYCQGYWLAIGVFVIAACIRLLRMKSVPMLPFLLVLTLFGAIVFYWFWEVKPAYALPFLYIFYLLAACGQNLIAQNADVSRPEMTAQKADVSRRKRWMLGYAVVIFLGIEYLYNNIIDSNKANYDYSIRCTQKGWLTQIAKEDGDTVTQEFYPSAAFNRIVLSVVVDKDSSSASISGDTVISTGGTATCLHVTLQDADGTIVYRGVITQEDIDSDNRVTLEVGEQSADTQGGYLLSITKENGSFGNINLRTRKGISLNAYKGEFYINGVRQGTDLYMQVYRYC